MGIEPTSEAWEASILPLYDARSSILLIILPSWSRNNRDAQGSDDPDKFHSTFAAPFSCVHHTTTCLRRWKTFLYWLGPRLIRTSATPQAREHNFASFTKAG